MITENLSTLKIHKLTQAQYDRELAAGNIDENALYLTPSESVFMTTATVSLAADGWENNIQTVKANGVTENNTVFIAAEPITYLDYMDCGIFCIRQNNGTLTFECEKVPTIDIGANISIFM